MKRTVFVLLFCLAIPAASAAVPADSETVARTTAKPTAQFAACFAGAEAKAARPWSYVPKENGGGTFSNVGAPGASSPYFLKVADVGSRRVIRLEAVNAAAGASVLSAVDACV